MEAQVFYFFLKMVDNVRLKITLGSRKKQARENSPLEWGWMVLVFGTDCLICFMFF
jgi:hypothetical protein